MTDIGVRKSGGSDTKRSVAGRRRILVIRLLMANPLQVPVACDRRASGSGLSADGILVVEFLLVKPGAAQRLGGFPPCRSGCSRWRVFWLVCIEGGSGLLPRHMKSGWLTAEEKAPCLLRGMRACLKAVYSRAETLAQGSCPPRRCCDGHGASTGRRFAVSAVQHPMMASSRTAASTSTVQMVPQEMPVDPPGGRHAAVFAHGSSRRRVYPTPRTVRISFKLCFSSIFALR